MTPAAYYTGPSTSDSTTEVLNTLRNMAPGAIRNHGQAANCISDTHSVEKQIWQS